MIQVVITTYNRGKEFRELIQNLATQEAPQPLSILVVDDFSTPAYSGGVMQEEWKGMSSVHRYHKNQGKKGFWKVFNTIFSKLQRMDFEYVVFFPDDFLPQTGFFKELIGQFQAIPDPRKACLSYFYAQQIRGKSNWTRVTPREYHHVYRTQWVDGAFIATRSMFDALDWEMKQIPQTRWSTSTHLGSGVGEQMSQRLLAKNLNMYHVDKSLITIQETKSVMNAGIRNQHPLTP